MSKTDKYYNSLVDVPQSVVTELDRLCHKLQTLKTAEADIKKQRVEVEAEIAALVTPPEEGTEKKITQYYKVTTTGKLTRSLDQSQALELRHEWPQELDHLFPVRVKYDNDIKKLRVLEQSHPELYRKFCKCLSTKPAKTAVKIEVLQ